MEKSALIQVMDWCRQAPDRRRSAYVYRCTIDNHRADANIIIDQRPRNYFMQHMYRVQSVVLFCSYEI